jgi:hypothetical protein
VTGDEVAFSAEFQAERPQHRNTMSHDGRLRILGER